MAVVRAYFDASGGTDDPSESYLSLAGYVSTEEKWDALDLEWQEVLSSEGLTHFHMKDFAHSNGEFESWRNDEVRRINLISRLSRIIGRHAETDIAITIDLDEYRLSDKRYCLREFGNPYSIAGQLVVSRTEEWMRIAHPEDICLYYFEKGDNGQDELIAHLRKVGIKLAVDPTFLEKSWVDGSGGTIYACPLQACDLIAYEHRKNVTDRRAKGRSIVRESMFSLLKSTGSLYKEYTVLGKPFFDGVCEELGIAKR